MFIYILNACCSAGNRYCLVFNKTLCSALLSKVWCKFSNFSLLFQITVQYTVLEWDSRITPINLWAAWLFSIHLSWVMDESGSLLHWVPLPEIQKKRLPVLIISTFLFLALFCSMYCFYFFGKVHILVADFNDNF